VNDVANENRSATHLEKAIKMMCVCVCVCERERECVCVCVNLRDCMYTVSGKKWDQ